MVWRMREKETDRLPDIDRQTSGQIDRQVKTVDACNTFASIYAHLKHVYIPLAYH